MAPLELAARFGTALGLGLVLGLERQRTQASGSEQFAGVRTFGLIALLGATAVHLDKELGLAWLSLAAFVSVSALVVASYVASTVRDDLGGTTEVTALLTFLIGGLSAAGSQGLATALAVTALLTLAIKGWSQRVAAHIESTDVEAALKFAIITVIVLPLLPDQAYGPEPLRVLNPRNVWLMVVLISGLNFASYVLVKVLGREHGIGVTGILGGLVSSTAVTLGFSQRSRQEPALAAPLALGILLAWTLMFFRVLAVVALVNAALGRSLALGIGLLGAVSLLACASLWLRQRGDEKGAVQSGSNPFELSEAVKFGLLFGVVTFAAKASEVSLGNAGLYLAGGIAGLTDVDAISLSMANLALVSPESTAVAARAILIAVLANTLVKAGMAVSLGGPELRRRLWPIAALLLGAGVAAAFLIG